MYCDLCVSLFVYLYARVSQKLHVRISPHFLYLLPVAVARSSSDGNAVMSCFHMIERMGRIGNDVYVSSSSPVWRHRGPSLPTPTVSS